MADRGERIQMGRCSRGRISAEIKGRLWTRVKEINRPLEQTLWGIYKRGKYKNLRIESVARSRRSMGGEIRGFGGVVKESGLGAAEAWVRLPWQLRPSWECRQEEAGRSLRGH